MSNCGAGLRYSLDRIESAQTVEDGRKECIAGGARFTIDVTCPMMMFMGATTRKRQAGEWDLLPGDSGCDSLRTTDFVLKMNHAFPWSAECGRMARDGSDDVGLALFDLSRGDDQSLGDGRSRRDE